MKTFLLTACLSFSTTALGADHAAIAFERFAYEVNLAQETSEKITSLSNYISSLDRLEAKPGSIEKCLGSLFSGSKLTVCSPVARSGGGTGGVD